MTKNKIWIYEPVKKTHKLGVKDYLGALDKTMIVVPLFFIALCWLSAMILNDGIIIININSVHEGWIETIWLCYAFVRSIVLLQRTK